MHISGGFAALDKEPLLYQSLLNTHYDIEIGKFGYKMFVCIDLLIYENLQHFFISFFAVESIRIDLPRTFPDNVFFENIRTPLFNVLVAYANHNKEIGYCQGLNYIAGESIHRLLGRSFKMFVIPSILQNSLLFHSRSNFNCHKKRRMDILAAKNPCRRNGAKLPYENHAWSHH